MTITADQRERLERLHSALVNDVTDEMGIRDNVIPGTRIRPVWSREPTVGTAHPAQRVEIGYDEGEDDEEDVAAEDIDFFQYLEAVEEGDFVVMAAPKDTEVGLWGELLSSIVQENGATGALIDGPTRDSRLIEEHEFPVWSDGHSSIESFGRVSFREWDVPVQIHGVTIEPGDVVFADYESIVVLDPDVVDEVIERGEEELETENQVRSDIRDGDSVYEVWDRYGTL
ncbi:Regulator of RNase E activity RraA [Halomicrobium zhouii]|uniref:Regulator of RNase E activity RraA n=1 Tax=Halomicrobium zhouii TaxID=767519 RepID=A0A1I6LI98_9EURY|nr:RraA family protein [Halomicrobium zhouii]SFS03217.1 Regulator of RNase E activity RraA [Halomicrobium zhouii]